MKKLILIFLTAFGLAFGVTTPINNAALTGSTTIAGNFTFNSTGQLTLADFSNATTSSRMLFKSSTVNGNTFLGAIPNGTATSTAYVAYNAVDSTNASYGALLITSTNVYLDSEKTGTGTVLPIILSVGGTTSMTATASLVTVGGDLTVSGGDLVLSGTSTITGGAGNMTITSGTGASRTLTLQTTTAGGTATNALTLNATQDATIGGDLTVSGGDVTLTGTSTITGGAGNMTITAGTGASRTLALRSTTAGGTATTFLTGDASQNTTLAGNLTLGASTSSITGAAGNMTILAGTGASRTLILQTTTSGSAATTALTLGADQSALIAGPAATDGAAISASTALNLPAATTSLSSLRLAHGAAPSAPTNGDMWTTTTGLFARINGSTVGPYGTGTASISGLTTSAIVTASSATAIQTPSATATMDASGNIVTPGTGTFGSGATTAGAVALTQGTTQSVGTTNITIQAPTSVTSWIRTLPGTVGSTGFLLETVAGSVQTESLVSAIPSAFTATTQAQGDRSTKIATDDFASPHINAQTGTTYTIAATDANQYLTLSNAGAITLTIPLNATTAYTDGDTIAIQQKGAGLVTVHPVSGSVTINGASSDIAFLGQYQWATLVKIGTGTDTWALSIGPRISVASGKTFTVSNTLTLAGTDSTTMTFPSTSATVARTDAANTFTGASTGTSWTMTTPVIASGLTASGSGANDFSGSSGTFKTSTGAVTLGSGAITISGSVAASGSNNFDLSAGTGTFKLPTGGLIAPNTLANRFRSNSSVSAQAPSATTRTYVTGSDIGAITAGQIAVGTIIEWDMSITKTGAGTATSTFDIAFGTNGTTGDTARVSFTKPAGVGNADTCHVHITAVVKTNSASGVVQGDFVLTDDQTNTLGGFLGAAKYASVLQVQSSTFDTTTPTHVGICITTGASDAYTINYCTVKSWNL